MVTETLKGTIKTVFGTALPESKWIPYSGPVELYTTIDEVKAANAYPTDKDLVSMINQSVKAAERASLMSAAIAAAGYSAPTLEDKSVQFAQMVKIFKATGQDDATARQSAEAALGHSGS